MLVLLLVLESLVGIAVAIEVGVSVLISLSPVSLARRRLSVDWLVEGLLNWLVELC